MRICVPVLKAALLLSSLKTGGGIQGVMYMLSSNHLRPGEGKLV